MSEEKCTGKPARAKIAELLGQAWETYYLSNLSKRYSVRFLACILQAQELIMQERELDAEIQEC